MNAHAQTLVKVNAQVDKGIAPLVEALNECPGVFTTGSCEGRERENAYVAFDVGGDKNKLISFVESLSSALGGDSRSCDVSFTLSVEWYAGGKSPNGYLRLPRRHIHALAEAIHSAAAAVATDASRHRRSGSSRGRECTEPRRSRRRSAPQHPQTCDGARASCSR
jgi:hypothetical protein